MTLTGISRPHRRRGRHRDRQVACHLLAQAGQSRAPWAITTIVSCLPVLVLAMGTALAHMLRGDATAGQPDTGNHIETVRWQS